ncbi:nucleotide pyrophosphohydrolase [Blattabacterium cuenoti]|uniref:nucleotide pyrophosphohydrolase n=1 Tax=Blattabacterium cuenoti TaxID=1653831 RepID=UPI00163C33F5|nr:nucleotide pyrophosphohydrolase [Blattabacterium cuenoti]
MKNIQKIVHEWIIKHGIRYFDILTNTILLSEEVGEVSRIIARKYGEQSKKINLKEKNEDLGEELSDVLFVIICLANQTGIDLEKSFNKKLEKKNEDHNRHHENKKLKMK